MDLTVGQQVKYWGIATIFFSVVLWYLGNVILPFVLGGAIAYCLDPLADRLERLGTGRALATSIIMLTAAVIFFVILLAVVPLLVAQARQLAETAPKLFADTRSWLETSYPSIFDGDSVAGDQLARFGTMLQDRAGTLVQGVLSSLTGLINIAVLVVLVPFITFYLLMDWDRMVARIDALLPREHAPTIRRLAREIDATLAAFIRGQGTVCLVLGIYYGVALMLVGLNFGLVIGFVAGLISFIPYIGALLGGIAAVGLALYQFWGEWWWIVAVAVIFQVGQLIEGNILTPKLVGGSVGLHPVWLIFALSVFGALFGFVGLLVAVPVAAVIGVLTRFGVEQYRSSPLYRGPATHDWETEPLETDPSETGED